MNRIVQISALFKQIPRRWLMAIGLFGFLFGLFFYFFSWGGLLYLGLTLSLCAIGFYVYNYLKANPFFWSKVKRTLYKCYLKQRIRIRRGHYFNYLRRRAHRSELPAFLLLGRPNSGKSTFLKQNQFHFSTQNTKHKKSTFCWWFGNHAVVIEGDLATSNELELKRKHSAMTEMANVKGHRIPRGIILAISAHDVLSGEMTTICKSLRVHIESIYQSVGFCIPVHLMITHLDQLIGFKEMFGSLDTKTRQQFCGFELDELEPLKPQAARHLTELYHSFSTQLMALVHLQTKHKDKVHALQFPTQFLELRERLLEGFECLIQENVYQETIYIADVHFISNGEPHSQIPSYFNTALFAKKWLSETPFERPTKEKAKRLNFYLKLGYVGLFLFTFLSVFCLIKAYKTNSNYIQQGTALAKRGLHLYQNQLTLMQQLLFTDKLSQHIYELQHFNAQHAWHDKLGMSQHKERALLESVLTQILDKHYYKLTKNHLLQQLQQLHKQWQGMNHEQKQSARGAYYAYLKLYFMLNHPQLIELDFATTELAYIWQQMSAEKLTQSALDFSVFKHVSHAYLVSLSHNSSKKNQYFVDMPLELIKQVRADLRTTSTVQNVYAQIEHQYSIVATDYSIEAILNGKYSEHWSSQKKLPRFYTLDAYQTTIKPIFSQYAMLNLKSDWVIHSPITHMKQWLDEPLPKTDEKEQAHLLHAFNEFYFKSYLQHWNSFVTSIHMVQFNSLDDAASQLRALYITDGALVELFKGLNHHLNIQSALTKTQYMALSEPLRYRFEEFNQLTQFNQDGKNSFLAPYQQQLILLEQDIERISLGSDLVLTPEHYVRQLFLEQNNDTALFNTSLLVEKQTNSINTLPVRLAIKSVLLSPVQETFRVLLNEAAGDLQRSWQSTVLQFYQHHLSAYFPFNPNGPDVNLAEFHAFFHPQLGVLNQFIQRLKPFVKEESGRWEAKHWLGVSSPFLPHSMHSLWQLNRLSHTLFRQKNQDISFEYAIYPIPTPGIKEILFASNTERYAYRNGPQEWVRFHWPAEDRFENESLIRVINTSDELKLVNEFQGPWGVFHLLKSAHKITKIDKGHRLEWQFKQGNQLKTIKLLVTSQSQADLFDALIFNPLKIPTKLVRETTNARV